MNLGNYRESIDQLARSMNGEHVLNGSAEHASIIIERMFNYAQNSMDILTRRFDPRIYGTKELVASASLFAGQPGRKTRIALEEANFKEFKNHLFASELEDFDSIEIRKIPEEFHEAIDFNFSVMDGNSFRFEKDKKEAVAVACFGDKGGFAKSLSEYFERIWEISIPISVSSLLKDHKNSMENA